jgi:hypothetical protein
MVAYVSTGECVHIFDPAVGCGAFFQAAKRRARPDLKLLGCEIDPATLARAKAHGLSEEDLAGVELRDFVLNPPAQKFSSIVANPPYLRHHRLPPAYKDRLKALARLIIGQELDGRAGLHVYFLIRALEKLRPRGRLAFIVPADTCEGVFAVPLWRWITKTFRLDAIVTFAPDASPFPGVDTNPVILFLQNSPPEKRFSWARCFEPGLVALAEWVESGFPPQRSGSLVAIRRSVAEALTNGFSREPRTRRENGPQLGDFAYVLRGIATGANHYFFLTENEVSRLRIPEEFLLPAIGRTRDVEGNRLTPHSFLRLKQRGRPVWLFSPDGRPRHYFPKTVQNYLQLGEQMGLPHRPLIASRRPWYKMERRAVPPILFAYLGRRNARFILNEAAVVPLTGFLCVYPRDLSKEFLINLWEALNDSLTLENLAQVGKSYGGGAIKVEPRALERLPIPTCVATKYGLDIRAQKPLLRFD